METIPSPYDFNLETLYEQYKDCQQNFEPERTPEMQPFFSYVNHNNSPEKTSSKNNSEITYYYDIQMNTKNQMLNKPLNEITKELSNINTAPATNFNTNTNVSEAPKSYPYIVNMVSLANLGPNLKLHLKQLALLLKNSEYDPKRLNAVILRIKEPKTVALIFNSGKFVCTGAKNEEDLKKASRKVGKIIKSLKYDVKLCNFKIINIVSTCDVKFQIKLRQLNKLEYIDKINSTNTNERDITLNHKNKNHKNLCRYEPEIFPGLIFPMMSPQVTFLIFKSGKMNILGAKTRDEIFKAFDKIYPLLTEFKLEERINKNESNTNISNIENLSDFSFIDNFKSF